MSWENEIYSIYDKMIGQAKGQDMLPVSHSTANAQIEITINEHGEMKSASIVDKEQSETIIPVTKDSVAKTSGICAHPLADKLIYVAGDYKDLVECSAKDKAAEKFDAYITQLKDWAESDSAAAGVKAVYNYMKQGRLIADLVIMGALQLDEKTGKLDKKIKLNGIDQTDAFVRFRIEYDDFSKNSETWKDAEMYQSFIDYDSIDDSDSQLCYATGRILPATYKHPSKIRNAGDKGKLIGSNDESGFTYRGRFENKEQALSVSYDFSQKFHNALKWLVRNQGMTFHKYYDEKNDKVVSLRSNVDGMTLVCWASSLEPVPDIAAQDAGLFGFDDEEYEYDSMPQYNEKINKLLFGRENGKSEGINNDKIMIMALDSATTGRLSVSFYSELARSDFLKNAENWHNDTSWYTYINKKVKYGISSFSILEIIKNAFGTEKSGGIDCDGKVLRENVLRLIPCITEGRKIPHDIVNALVRKASKPLGYEEQFNHAKVVNTACGMIRKQYKEKGIEVGMGLDENCTDRNYLYGRLLAVAEKAELDTYSDEEKKSRVPNARRYWEKFVQSPYTTWERIYEKLNPYLQKLGNSNRYDILINKDIKEKFTIESYSDNSRLSPLYLLGYSHQMNDFYKKKNETTTNEED
ncbi:MAG: type I-C CRISPR-associated protein Cas8c/Csd1 [Oscillospiraceae bacterium]